jgi:hypothetical protein
MYSDAAQGLLGKIVEAVLQPRRACTGVKLRDWCPTAAPIS